MDETTPGDDPPSKSDAASRETQGPTSRSDAPTHAPTSRSDRDPSSRADPRPTGPDAASRSAAPDGSPSRSPGDDPSSRAALEPDDPTSATGSASTTGSASRTPPEALFREGHRYDFFQAVRLLQGSLGGPPMGTTPDARAERVEVRPSDALSFPGADVRRVERLPGGRARVTATFDGLYGVDSPLPTPFHEPVTTDPDRTRGLRDFLDLFAGRLYALLYRAWAKSRPELADAVPAADGRRFRALAGVAQDAPWDAPAGALELAAFAGRLSDRRRNADGLRAIAQSLVGVPVTVIENVPRWLPIPSRPTLGSARPQLGANAPLGTSVLDLTGKIRLEIGPLTMGAFQDLLPGGEMARTLAAAVRLYTRDALSCEVELVLDASEITKTHLGDGLGQMGRTVFVGQPQGTDVRRVATYDVAAAAP